MLAEVDSVTVEVFSLVWPVKEDAIAEVTVVSFEFDITLDIRLLLHDLLSFVGLEF